MPDSADDRSDARAAWRLQLAERWEAIYALLFPGEERTDQ